MLKRGEKLQSELNDKLLIPGPNAFVVRIIDISDLLRKLKR